MFTCYMFVNIYLNMIHAFFLRTSLETQSDFAIENALAQTTWHGRRLDGFSRAQISKARKIPLQHVGMA